jgi:Rrf2 family iron-sulfur cluster assembly transcriptional regulator
VKLTRQGEYAIRATLELARNYGRGLLSAKEVASKQEIPLMFLPKILSTLTKNGLIVSQRGAGGGIRLSRPAAEITVREVIEAIEGPFALNACLGEAGFCGRKPACKVHQMWLRAQQALFLELAITLDKLI